MKQPTESGTRRQVAALPMRREEDGSSAVLLLTSRQTRRWVIPKGWPMRGLKDHEAAAVEAREEAGVVGRVRSKSLGTYSYFKRTPSRFDLVEVSVYRLDVTRQLKKWREKGQRELRWVPAGLAADLVDEPQLAALLRRLAGEAASAPEEPAAEKAAPETSSPETSAVEKAAR